MATLDGLTASQFAWACIGSPPWPPPEPKRGKARFGAHPRCWLCGGPTEGEGWPRTVAIPDTFTNTNLAAVPVSDAVCQPCVYMSAGDAWRDYTTRHPEKGLKSMQPLSWRSYSHVFRPGFHDCPTRAGWRTLLLNPPQPPFLFVIAVTGQKHLLFRGQIAHSRDVYPAQLEEEGLIVPRRIFARLLADFELLYQLGFSKDSILSGVYHAGQMRAVGERLGLETLRRLLQGMERWRQREPGLMRLAHFCAQRADTEGDAAECARPHAEEVVA